MVFGKSTTDKKGLIESFEMVTNGKHLEDAKGVSAIDNGI